MNKYYLPQMIKLFDKYQKMIFYLKNEIKIKK